MAIDFKMFNAANKARLGEAADKPRQVEDGSGSWATIFKLDKAPYDLKFWKPVVGTNYIDIIPLEVTNENNPAVKSKAVSIGDYDFGINIWTHRGNDASNNKPHVCLKRNYGKNCPRCDAFFETYEKGVKGSGNEKHGSSLRNYMIVVPCIDPKTPGTEAFLWDAPASPKGGFPILERAKEMADGDGIVFFWWPTEDGRTVSFETKEGSMKGSLDYSVIKFHKRPVEVAQALASKFSFPLDSLLIVNSDDEINRDIYGGNEATTAPAEEEAGMDPDAFGAPVAEVPKAVEAPKAPAPAATPVTPAPVAGAPKAEGNDCPYGHTFGKDWSLKSDCTRCEKPHKTIEAACTEAS